MTLKIYTVTSGFLSRTGMHDGATEAALKFARAFGNTGKLKVTRVCDEEVFIFRTTYHEGEIGVVHD